MREVPFDKGKLLKQDHFDWLLPIYGASAVVAIALGISLLKDWDFAGLGYVLMVLPTLAVCVLGLEIFFILRRRYRRSASLFVAFVVFIAVSLQLERYSSELRAEALWLLHSSEYKAEVLTQPAPATNALRHIDWFGWGFAGSGTEMYLAYDPNSSLANKNPATGRYGPLHCDVWKVQRLERHWYAVTFATNTFWDYPTDCDSGTTAP